jgi:hypothetical protein
LSSTVSFGSMTVDSTNESAADMIAVLDPKPEKEVPKVLKDRGKEPEPEEEKDEVSEAASKLGKEGGKAAAKARKAAAKEAKAEPEPEPEEAPEAQEARQAEEEKAKAAKAKEVDDEGLTERGRKRIEQATSAAAALKRENQRLMAELQRREAQPRAENGNGQPEQRAEPKAPPSAMPKMEDFENFEEYLTARDDYRDAQRDKREAKQRQEAEFHATVEYVLDTYETRLKKAVADNPDIRFDQRLFMVPESFAVPPGQKVGPSNVIKDEIVKSEVPAQLLEHFTNHPEDWQRIASASMSVPDGPGLIAREIARLEGRLGSAIAGSSQPTPSKSKAKPPFQPVKGSPHTDSGEPDENAPLSAFIRNDGQRRIRSSR